MAAQTDSDDASEIFWPGYVDAVTNLAINLLFVIAVMSIVVIVGSLKISQGPQSQLSGGKGEGKVEVLQNGTSVAVSKGEKQTQGTTDQEKLIQQQKQLIADLQKSLEQARIGTTASIPSTKGALDVVQAKERSTKEAKPNTGAAAGQTSTRDISSGVLVVFAPDVIELSEAEAGQVLQRMAKFGSPQSGRWSVLGSVPKGGTTESNRLAFNRVMAVRNVLIKNGIQAKDIEFRVVETDQSGGANPARVLIKPGN